MQGVITIAGAEYVIKITPGADIFANVDERTILMGELATFQRLQEAADLVAERERDRVDFNRPE